MELLLEEDYLKEEMVNLEGLKVLGVLLGIHPVRLVVAIILEETLGLGEDTVKMGVVVEEEVPLLQAILMELL